MELKEAYSLIDSVLENIALKRKDHGMLQTALHTLYTTALDNQESNQDKEPDNG